VSYHTCELEGKKIINILGEFDSQAAAEMRGVFEDFIENDDRDLVINLGQTTPDDKQALLSNIKEELQIVREFLAA